MDRACDEAVDHTDRKQEEVKAEVESLKAESMRRSSGKCKVELAMQKMEKLVSMSLQSQQEVNEQLRVLSDRSGRARVQSSQPQPYRDS